MDVSSFQARLESSDFSCEGIQVRRLTGREAIGQIFEIDLEIAVAGGGELDPDKVVGAAVDVVFDSSGTDLRRVHGMVARVEDMLDLEPELRSYRLRVHPRAFRLALVETNEVFLDMTVPEIIKQKLSLVGLRDRDVDLRLTGSYPKREIVTEYKETDLAFVSRLAEHLGVSFFFEQVDGIDRMVFTDNPAGFHPVQRDEPLVFRPHGVRSDIYRLASTTSAMPSVWMLGDYNYRMPLVDLDVTQEAEGALGGGVFEFGSHHKTPQQGQALVEVRAQEREAACRFFTGESAVCQLAAGATFTVEDHPRLDGKKLLLVEVVHELAQSVALQSGVQGGMTYRNTFRAVDASRPYRPPRVTPRPRIHGVVTALVQPREDGAVGKIAEMDDQGRYTVQFYFDIASRGERARSSHRVRLIQHHVGPDYGTHLPLKAGIEVLVVFVDGDPDRPLIVGAVPNPVTPSPVTAADPTMHRIKTASGILVQMKDHFRSS
jgi:type VI secretion system secreted protein VgrG